MKKLLNILTLSLAVCLGTVATSARADFTIIVPFAVGGAFDKQARLFANHVTATTNEKVVVKNITGAGSIIGTKELLSSDSNTIMISSGSFYKNIMDGAFKKEDFRLINVLGVSPYTLTTAKNLSCDDIKDSSKNFFIGTAGPGSASDTATLILQSKYKNFTAVPYKGIAQALLDLIPGRIDFVFVAGQTGSARPDFKSVTTTSTNNFYPGIPNWKTCLGMDVNYLVDYVVVTKAGAPDEFVRRINDLTNSYVNNKEVREQMSKEDGITPTGHKYQDLDKHYNAVLNDWRKIKNIIP